MQLGTRHEALISSHPANARYTSDDRDNGAIENCASVEEPHTSTRRLYHLQ